MYNREFTVDLCKAFIAVLRPFEGRLAAFDRQREAHCYVVQVKMHPARTWSGDYAADGTGRYEIVLQSPDYLRDGNVKTWSYWLDSPVTDTGGLPIHAESREVDVMLMFAKTLSGVASYR
jgi:hypothetical protein